MTIGLIFGTGILGAAIARREGVRVLARIQAELTAGRLPADHMIDGVILIVGGALLLTPGLLTDVAGLLALIPPTRVAIRKWAQRKFSQWVNRGVIEVHVRRDRFEGMDHFDDRDDDRHDHTM